MVGLNPCVDFCIIGCNPLWFVVNQVAWDLDKDRTSALVSFGSIVDHYCAPHHVDQHLTYLPRLGKLQ
jgi:hypothetical protein